MDEKGKLFSLNGIELHVIEKGHIGQPTIIFLHGFPEFWYGWRNQIEYFAAKGFHVLVPDQRGYNLSSKPKGINSYQVRALAEDIAQLIQAAGEEKVYLVGHDWGGAVAWTMGYLYPQLIKKMIIINMPHPRVFFKTVRRDLNQVMKSWYIGFFQLPGIPEKMLSLYQYTLLKNTLLSTSLHGAFSQEDLLNYQQAWKQKDALHSMIKWYRAAMRNKNPVAEYSHELELPVLLIWGEKDKFLKKQMAHKTLSYCQNGRLYTFPEATHWVHHEKSQQVNELIYEFIG